MNMKHMIAGMLAALALPLVAEDSTFFARAGLVLTQHGQLKSITGKTNGMNFEGGILAPNAGGLGLELRPYVGYYKIDATVPGASEPERYSMQVWRVGLDMVWAEGRVFDKPWAFRTGPLLSSYWALGARNPTPLTTKTWRLGWRAGVDLSINEKWSVGADATVSEWRSETTQPTVRELNPNNPLTWNLMVGYRF